MDSAIDDMTSGGALPGQASDATSGWRPIPLRRRRVDWILLAFFAVNLFFITYFVDIEQLTIANPYHFSYPAWPPHFIVDLVHSYGRKYDPLLMARPAFWRMTIWIDVLWNGPFYVAAIYAIIRGREWIRVPALIWSGSMSAVVLIILSEEYNGIHASPDFPIVLLLNVPWLALPLGTIVRMARQHPFTELAGAAAAGTAATAASVLARAATRWRHVMKASDKPPAERQPASTTYARAEAQRLFNWYVRNAKRSRLRFQVSELILLIAAAGVPVAGILAPHDSRPAAIVGAALVVVIGIRSVFHWHDDWARYTAACTAIKAELLVYEAGVAAYDDPVTRDEILLRKVNSSEVGESAQWMAIPVAGSDPEKAKTKAR